MAQGGAARPPLRVARVIARLNVGGPARHVLDATRGLAPSVETTLFAGAVGPDETEATAWIRASGVAPERVPGLGRRVSPIDDLRALRHLTRRFRELRPDIVHTHTAKAGALGRVAARRAGVPFVVHTFHGHVLDGYFGRAATRAIVAAERRLARSTDVIVAVSQEVADDLVGRFRIAPRGQVRVIPPGIDLDALVAVGAAARDEARAALGIDRAAPVVVWTGRLVPVKEPELLLDVARRVAAQVPGVCVLVAGDGPERAALEGSAPPCVRLLGVREDMVRVLAAADVALLTSRNEGTPVALVEAAAAGVPSVATRVGGVASVVEHGTTGLLAPHGDAAALAAHVVALLLDPPRRAAMGAAARCRACERFPLTRLLADLRSLYDEIAGGR